MKSSCTRKKRGTRYTRKPESICFFDDSIVGAGGYGIVLKNPREPEVLKLFKNLDDWSAITREAEIQNYVQSCLSHIKVPRVTFVATRPYVYKDTTYLCGIGMEYLEPPTGFQQQVHILLGYKQDDIDSEWGATISQPVSATNPTRGFFASPETMEEIFDEEVRDMTIEKIAYQMGQALRFMIDLGVIPIDLEWVWSKGSLCILDFGLCEFGHVDPRQFLEAKGLRGIADDIYVPHEGDRGYEEFMKGYSTSTSRNIDENP
jgi:hypothetical protein